MLNIARTLHCTAASAALLLLLLCCLRELCPITGKFCRDNIPALHRQHAEVTFRHYINATPK
jgi:hypothetical protein